MSDFTDFLRNIGFRIVIEKDKVTLAVGGNKIARIPQKPLDPPSDDSAVMEDDNET